MRVDVRARRPDGLGVGAESRERCIRSAAELGAERAGLDDQHADAERCDLGRQRLGHPLERELRRAVGAESGRRDLAAHRAHLHDRAAALRAHMRQHRLRQGDGAEEHRVHERAQLAGVDLLDRADRAVAGVVDEHVDAAEALERGATAAATWASSVTSSAQREHAVGRAGDELVERLRAARRGDDAVAARSAACAMWRPKPEELPVMSQTRESVEVMAAR